MVRNSFGKMVAAGFYQSHFNGNVSFAEAEAVQWGTQLAREAAITSCIIESDCVEVVELVNNTNGLVGWRIKSGDWTLFFLILSLSLGAVKSIGI